MAGVLFDDTTVLFDSTATLWDQGAPAVPRLTITDPTGAPAQGAYSVATAGGTFLLYGILDANGQIETGLPPGNYVLTLLSLGLGSSIPFTV